MEKTLPEFVPNVQCLIDRLKSNFNPDIESKTLNIYPWGSRAYGCATESSDWDFVFVIKDEEHISNKNETEAKPRKLIGDIEKTYAVYEDPKVNATFIPISHFRHMVMEHKHIALECVMLPNSMKWKELVPIEYKVDSDILRRTCFWESQQRFNTAKNKLKANDLRRGAKELVHCVRYLLFAIQILKHGCIIDYGEANVMWKETLEKISTQTVDELIRVCSDRISKYKDILKNINQTYKFYGRAEHIFYTISGLRRIHINKVKNLKEEVKKFPLKMNSEDYGLITIKILQEKGLEFLESTFGVHTKRHSKHNNLVLFYSYLHTNNPQSKSIERECNGLILDEEDSWKPVCFPHLKIPHYTMENNQNTMDWKTARAYQHLDGLSANLYYYKGEWHLASQFEPDDPQSLVNWKDETRKTTFSYLFWSIWESLEKKLPEDTSKCFMFQITSRRHRFVIRYDNDDIYLTGVRDMKTMQELDVIKFGTEYKFNTPKESKLQSLIDLIRELNSESHNPFIGDFAKGYIICDERFERIKVDSHQFISIEEGTDWSTTGTVNFLAEIDERQVMRMIRHGEIELFLSYFPQWITFASKCKEKYELKENEIQDAFLNLKNTCLEKRDFAIKARNYSFYQILFLLYDGSYKSAKDYLALCDDKVFYRIILHKETE